MKNNFYQNIENKLSDRESRGILRSLESFENYDNFINFSSNDYLGLSRNPDIIEYAKSAIDRYGVGLSQSPVLLKNSIYRNAVDVLSKTQNRDSGVIFSSGYIANLSGISAILKTFNADNLDIFSDRLNHASIQNGIISSGLRQKRYRNCDMNNLEDLLKKSTKANKIVFTESVFSMDGTIVDIENLVYLKRKYGFLLYIDEAHSFGIFGKNGYGLSAGFGGEVDFFMTSLSKSVPANGGFICCNPKVANFLENFASGFVYSTALNPVALSVAIKSSEMIQNMKDERLGLLAKSKFLLDLLKKNEFKVVESDSQIVSILIDENRIFDIQDCLKNNGILVSAIRYPTVPLGSSRLRICLNVNHSIADLENLAKVLKSYA
jgi:8-amino-7-oxononanoate synthase